jgi:hypothetical protein
MRKSLLISVAIVLFMTGYIALANATSNYTVTSNFHGYEAPPGTTIIVTASTSDTSVEEVMFRWRDASGTLQWENVVPISRESAVMLSAEDSYAPDSIGDWGVQALFIGADGKTKQQVEDVIAIRATSLNVVPEIPVLGTIGASIAMVAGLTYEVKRKNKNSLQRN